MVWYRFDKKKTTDDLLQLNIGWLKKHNYLKENAIINGGLTWNRKSAWGETRKIASLLYTANFIGEKRTVTLSYTYKGNEKINSEITIACSFPYYGGKRYWFLCPKCGRKVAFLYGDKYFWCRHCHNLSYPTQQIGYAARMFEKSRKYQDKALIDGCRRPWIHNTTLEKYLDKSEHYELLGLATMYKSFRKML